MTVAVESLSAALALWGAVRPRTLEVAASGSATRVARLSGLVEKLAPHFEPLAYAALESRDPDKCATRRQSVQTSYNPLVFVDTMLPAQRVLLQL